MKDSTIALLRLVLRLLRLLLVRLRKGLLDLSLLRPTVPSSLTSHILPTSLTLAFPSGATSPSLTLLPWRWRICRHIRYRAWFKGTMPSSRASSGFVEGELPFYATFPYRKYLSPSFVFALLRNAACRTLALYLSYCATSC